VHRAPGVRARRPQDRTGRGPRRSVLIPNASWLGSWLMGPGPDDMMSAVSDSMQARTGRSLEEWVALVQSSGIDPLDQNAVRRWLKSVHGVPQNSQWAIADAAARAAGWVRPTVEENVAGRYTGAKAARAPAH